MTREHMTTWEQLPSIATADITQSNKVLLVAPRGYDTRATHALELL
jgi:hypothetical protein